MTELGELTWTVAMVFLGALIYAAIRNHFD